MPPKLIWCWGKAEIHRNSPSKSERKPFSSSSSSSPASIIYTETSNITSILGWFQSQMKLLVPALHSHSFLWLSRKMKKTVSSCSNSGCSTAVEHTPHNQEVMSLNPTYYWAFSFYLVLLSFNSRVSLIRTLSEVHHYFWCESHKNGCLAVLAGGKTSSISTDWVKKLSCSKKI